MVYEQYSDHLKVCRYLGKEPEGEFKEFHNFITELWKDMEISEINNHNKQSNGHTIMLHKGTDFYMQQDFKNGYLRCDWDRIWIFFTIKKSMKVPETRDFIRGMVEEHLKCKVSTPEWIPLIGEQGVEEHLKCKVSTPQGEFYGIVALGWKNISNARYPIP